MNRMLRVETVRSGEVHDQAGRVIIIFILHYIKSLIHRDSQWLLYRVGLPILHLLNGFATNTNDNSSVINIGITMLVLLRPNI